MRRLAVVAAAVAALATPSTALGGGMAAWAMSGPSRDIQAGEVWLADLRVVGCVGTPLQTTPTVTIVSQSGETRSFRGRPTAKPGKYTARVVFPSPGRWSYRVAVNRWGAQAHGPFVVGPVRDQARPLVAARTSGEPSRLLAALPPVGAALLVLGTGLILRRRRA